MIASTTTHKHKREPLAHLIKRDDSSLLYRFFVRIVAVIIALTIILLFIRKVTDYPIGKILSLMFQGSFATEYTKSALLKDISALLIISLALAPAFKMKFWNIGAQGQVLMGALLTATIMIELGSKLSNGTLIFVMLLVSIAAGGIWALIPALFKVKLNANETLFTLMLNYIAIQLVACCIDKWKGPNVALGIINSNTKAGYLPTMFGNDYGFLIFTAVLLTIGMYIYLRQTKQGYEIAVVGESLNTARYAGISTSKVILRTMFISGAIAGLCGFLYVGGVNHSISSSVGGSYGFTAIIVAWAAKFNPFTMAIISFIIVFLERGSTSICDTTSNLNSYTAYIIVGIFLILLISCEFFINYKIVYNSKITGFFASLKQKISKAMPRTARHIAIIAYKVKAAKAAIKTQTDKLSGKIELIISIIKQYITKALAKAKYAVVGLFVKKKGCCDAIENTDAPSETHDNTKEAK